MCLRIGLAVDIASKNEKRAEESHPRVVSCTKISKHRSKTVYARIIVCGTVCAEICLK